MDKKDSLKSPLIQKDSNGDLKLADMKDDKQSDSLDEDSRPRQIHVDEKLIKQGLGGKDIDLKQVHYEIFKQAYIDVVQKSADFGPIELE